MSDARPSQPSIRSPRLTRRSLLQSSAVVAGSAAATLPAVATARIAPAILSSACIPFLLEFAIPES